MFIHLIYLLKPSEGVQNIPEITVDNAGEGGGEGIENKRPIK